MLGEVERAQILEQDVVHIGAGLELGGVLGDDFVLAGRHDGVMDP
ncbi:MAG: hypothetical protein QOI83_2922, partial [Streptomycetaceae bacterium]|nr:hypothetical protein [Streptomycetaceae bacterium]